MNTPPPTIPKIDVSAIAERLLGQRSREDTLPAGWLAGERPKAKEPLDAAIKALLDADHSPKIARIAVEPPSYWTACPYYAARRWVVAAADRAWLTTRRDINPLADQKKIDILRAERQQAKTLAASLEQFLAAAAFIEPDCLPGGIKIVKHGWHAVDRRLDFDNLRAATKEVAKREKELSTAIGELGNRGRAHDLEGAIRAAFAGCIGQAWHALTDCEPVSSREGPFTAFLNAAWNAALPDAEVTSWTRVIERVVRDERGHWHERPAQFAGAYARDGRPLARPMRPWIDQYDEFYADPNED